jgi:hypothetical protein
MALGFRSGIKHIAIQDLLKDLSLLEPNRFIPIRNIFFMGKFSKNEVNSQKKHRTTLSLSEEGL